MLTTGLPFPQVRHLRNIFECRRLQVDERENRLSRHGWAILLRVGTQLAE